MAVKSPNMKPESVYQMLKKRIIISFLSFSSPPIATAKKYLILYFNQKNDKGVPKRNHKF